MISPEIWNFKAPDSLFKVENGKINNNSCFDTIEKFNYNHLVSVVLPDTFHTPEALCDLLKTDCEYYKISNFTIHEFVNINFINNFIKKGTFTALTVDERIDCDNCICVTPNGLILLSLNKESYESFGLEGSVSHFYCHTKERYIVCINLLNTYFKPGKSNYEKTKECLRKLEKFTLIISWEAPTPDICPSSVAKYFDDLNYDVTLCTPDFQIRTDYTVKVPRFNPENIHEFVEWLGIFSLNANLGGLDNYLSTYETPEPHEEYGQVKFLQWRGFFTTQQIKKLLEQIIIYNKSEEKPWVSMYVQGFSDSVVGWDTQEHHYYTNGDNSYIVLLNSDDYWLYRQICSKKCYK